VEGASSGQQARPTPALARKESSRAVRPDARFATAATVTAPYSFSAEQSYDGCATASWRSSRAPPPLQPWQRQSRSTQPVVVIVTSP
jgi:hypothetical protein